MSHRATDGIRAKVRKDGYQTVHFEESPGHWIATPYTDRDKAIKWAKRNRAMLVNRRNDTFGAYCADLFRPASPWVERMRKKGHHYTNKYLANRQGYVDNYILPEFGDADPRAISRREIDDWLLILCKRGPKSTAPGAGRKELAGATKNKILYTLSIIFEELRDLDVIAENPISGIRSYSNAPIAPRGVIDRESLDRIFPATHGALVRVWGSSMWAAMMLVFADTGSRPGEVRALTWRDIDIAKRFIPIRKGIESGTTDKIKGTKTGAVKAGFLSTRTVQELEIWRAESRFAGDGDYVFTLTGVAPVTDEGTLKAFRRGVTGAGIDATNWTPYWLRHSFATYQMETLTDEEIVRLMGTSVEIKRRHYAHPDDMTLYLSTKDMQDKIDEAREKLERALMSG